MNTIENLRQKLSELRTSRKSGIISICAEPGTQRGDEDFYETHRSMVYLFPLDTVYISIYSGTEYWTVGKNKLRDDDFRDFVGRTDECSAESLGYSEKEYLDERLRDLVWDMAHDEGECPELDDECQADYFLEYADSDFDSFFLTGEDSLESDITAFRGLIDTGHRFCVDGQEFFAGTNADTLDYYERKANVLYEVIPKTYHDEDTGDDVPVELYVSVLATLDWRTLYAKSRTLIYSRRKERMD